MGTKTIKVFFEGPFFATITTKSNLGTKSMFTVNTIKTQVGKKRKKLERAARNKVLAQ